MKKLLLSAAFLLSVGFAQAQVMFTENFDALGEPFTMPAGWTQTNQSAPVGTIGWFRGGGGTTFGGYNGGQTGYIGANFNSTAGTGVISNWLMSPVLSLQNNDIITFYSRTATGSIYADNLEMRISTQGAASVNPVGVDGVGSYTTLAVTVNPLFPSAAGYPQVWTQYTYVVSGLTGPTDSRIAFRYTVPTSAGPTGDNSNFIGIDAVQVDRPLSTADFFRNNFSMYPNPAKDVLNIAANNQVSLDNATITDINGRIVKQQSLNAVTAQINVSDLNAGVYFISIESFEGKGTTKFIKN